MVLGVRNASRVGSGPRYARCGLVLAMCPLPCLGGVPDVVWAVCPDTYMCGVVVNKCWLASLSLFLSVSCV